MDRVSKNAQVSYFVKIREEGGGGGSRVALDRQTDGFDEVNLASRSFPPPS